MNNPKISIIVTIYNLEKYINKCVDSLLHQTYDNVEIILVDDGSTDSSPEICNQIKLNNPNVNIIVIHKPNGGLVSAWKSGVNAATGDYISFVDADDYIDIEMISEMVEKTSDESHEIISSDYIIERDNGKNNCVFQEALPGEYLEKEISEKIIPNLLGNEHRLIHVSRCMKLISRQLILDNIAFADESMTMGEDFVFMLACFFDMKRLYVMNHKTYYHYLYVETSMIHKYDAKLRNNVLHLYDVSNNIINSKFGGHENVSIREHQLNQMSKEYILHLLLLLKNEARGNPKHYISNIKDIAKDDKNSSLVKKYPVYVKDKANILLYLVLKHPNVLNCFMLRLAMLWYYRK